MFVPTKVLFVCLGNICRSPLAEGIFKKKIADLNLTQSFIADSCGTGDYHIGSQPDLRTIRNASRNGVILDHKCRQITSSDLENFDLIIAMDSSIKENILWLENAAKHKDKIYLMRNFDHLAEHVDVPDPYHGNEKDFQEVFQIIDRSMGPFISFLQNRNGG